MIELTDLVMFSYVGSFRPCKYAYIRVNLLMTISFGGFVMEPYLLHNKAS